MQLEAIVGSMAQGERALSWIKDFTRNTPFQLEEVSEAFAVKENCHGGTETRRREKDFSSVSP